MEFKDYYTILKIESDASSDDVRQAYRKLARKYHPDINQDDPNLQARFQAITEAQIVLLKPPLREKYDKLQASWQAHQQDNDADADNDEEAEFDWAAWIEETQAKPPGPANKEADGQLSEFYRAIFAPLAQTPAKAIEASEATDETYEETTAEEDDSPADSPAEEVTTAAEKRDHIQPVEITLEEAFRGTSRILKIGKQRIKVQIPRGAKTSTRIRVRGKKGQSLIAEHDGELYLEIVEKPHPIFFREGDDLHANLELNLYVAILGGEAIVPTLGKGKLRLKIPPETQTGRSFRLKELGMPNLNHPDNRGDLYVKTVVLLPENLTPEEIALFEELADIRGM